MTVIGEQEYRTIKAKLHSKDKLSVHELIGALSEISYLAAQMHSRINRQKERI